MPTGLVVKNGVNMRARTSAEIPVPVSATPTTTRPCSSREVESVIWLAS